MAPRFVYREARESPARRVLELDRVARGAVSAEALKAVPRPLPPLRGRRPENVVVGLLRRGVMARGGG